MSRKSKQDTRVEPGTVSIPAALLDELVKGPMTATEVHSLTMALKKAVIERAMQAELSHHLGYRDGDERPVGQTNHRNGHSAKTVLTDDGPVRVAIPRDRDGAFEPILIPKHARRFTGFDDKIIAMYARGMTVREIQRFLAEQYGTTVSPEFISSVTDEVLAEVTAWQQRPLEPMYPVVFFDALRVKIRDGTVQTKSVYVALAVLPDGTRDVLGFWIAQTESAKFWLTICSELKARGVRDILITVVDGLTGLAPAIETVFPATTVQTCIVHLLRNSLTYVGWKERQPLARALRPIYTAPTADAAREALTTFAASPWALRFPSIVPSWERAWDQVVPFFAFPPAVRHLIYTTNAIESLHMRLRKIIKTRGHFPSDEAACKLLWLSVMHLAEQPARSVRAWREAMQAFAIFYGERFTAFSR